MPASLSMRSPAVSVMACAAIITCIFVILLPLSIPYIRSIPIASSTAKRDTCETPGDGDIYGLGVRLGLYLQWGANFILRNLGSWERVSRVRTASNVLCSALALAAAISIVSGTALTIDYLLSYYLTIVLFYAESYNLEIQRPKGGRTGQGTVYKLYPDLPLIFQNLYFAAYTLFGAWFWTKGVSGTRVADCPERAAIVFMFPLRESRWMIAATSISVLAGVLFSLFFTIHFLKGIRKGLVHDSLLEPLVWMEVASGVMSIGLSNDFFAPMLRPKMTFDRDILIASLLGILHYALVYLVGPLVAIISVERMVKENGLVTPGIWGSTGQMIALFTGSVSMGLALWEAIRVIKATSTSPPTASLVSTAPSGLSPTPQASAVTAITTLYDSGRNYG